MKKSFVMGLDIGTTSAKAVLFNFQGQVIQESEISYPHRYPQAGWAEQDPDEIEQAAITAIHHTLEKSALDSKEIVAVGLSSAMHSILCLDQSGKPLSPLITWADQRSSLQAERLKNENGIDIYHKTGTPIHPMSPLVKLIWMRETKYEPYLKAHKFVSIKEYLIYKWFGKYIVDYSVASASGLFNIHNFQWEKEALHLAGISAEQLSTPVPPTEVCKGLSPSIAGAMGLQQETLFVLGGSDGPLANLGIGAFDPNKMALTIGTSGALRRICLSPQTTAQQEVFCYAFSKNTWVIGGASNNGGNVLKWLKDLLGSAAIQESPSLKKDIYESMVELVGTLNAGANGLLFLPFLHGERAPHWDPKARGSFIGLTSEHKTAHLLRAGLEGVIFNMYQIYETLSQHTGSADQILASGGFARSGVWLQILADVFQKEVLVPESHQSSAWGASWNALYALGLAPSYQAITDFIPMKTTIYPQEINKTTYQDLYTTYKSLYEILKPAFHALGSK